MPSRTRNVARRASILPLAAWVGTAAWVGAAAWAPPVAWAQHGEVPPGIPVEGFTQLLPRGAIAAVVDPVFVAAGEAEMPDDAWILGYAAGDEAYAYDLNLLNSHEIVNHDAAGAPIAAVW